MGIVSFCPQGHRVKVKDHLAGKKGVCPTCGARFRIPLASVEPPPTRAESATLPLATVVACDAAIMERLPRAILLSRSSSPGSGPAAPTAVPAAMEPGAEEVVEFEAEDAGTRLHPLIAERPELAWCHAVPGGTASEPLAAEAMQAWLEAGRPTGVELVWRADWPDWRPIAHVFPEHVPARSG